MRVHGLNPADPSLAYTTALSGSKKTGTLPKRKTCLPSWRVPAGIMMRSCMLARRSSVSRKLGSSS